MFGDVFLEPDTLIGIPGSLEQMDKEKWVNLKAIWLSSDDEKQSTKVRSMYQTLIE